MPLHKKIIELVLLAVCLGGWAQEKCLFDHKNKHFKLHRNIGNRFEINTDTNYIIPIIVHVFHTGDNSKITSQQVYSQIEALNRDFNRLNEDTTHTPLIFDGIAKAANIKFVLATKDPNGQKHTGIKYINSALANHNANETRKLTARSMWPSDLYLNIYVVKEITGSGSTALGYAQQPGADSTTDVVVIDYNYFGTTGTVSRPFHLGRTAVHEVGHWLGLSHLWGSPSEVGNFCDEDDGIEDTPNQKTSNYGCTAHPHISCNNEGDMFMNYMDYSDDSCMYMFSRGQVNFMHFVLQKDSLRQSISRKSHTDTISYIVPYIQANGNNFCDSSIQNFSLEWQGKLELKWLLENEEENIDTLTNNNSKISLANLSKGQYNLMAYINNDTLYDTLVYSFAIHGCSTGLNETMNNGLKFHHNKLFFDQFTSGKLMIFDLSGQIVLNQDIKSKSLDVNHLQPGLYIIKYNQSDIIYSRKIIIR